MSDEIRQIKIAGAKPSDFKRKRTRKNLKGGGEEEEQPQSPKGPINIRKVDEIATAPPLPIAAPVIPPISVNPTPTPAATEQLGGNQKVVLKPKVARPTKVLLRKKEPISGPIMDPKPVKVKTRKVILNAISKKLNKTRHAMKHAKELPIDQVRAVLIDKKLIKPTSKAPDSILRQIYSDSLIVAKKTL